MMYKIVSFNSQSLNVVLIYFPFLSPKKIKISEKRILLKVSKSLYRICQISRELASNKLFLFRFVLCVLCCASILKIEAIKYIKQ